MNCKYFTIPLMLSNDTIMKPPYRITPTILSYIASISEKIGEVRTAYLNIPQTELRRENRIKTIQASLSLAQVSRLVPTILLHKGTGRRSAPAEGVQFKE